MIAGGHCAVVRCEESVQEKQAQHAASEAALR